MVYQLFNIKAGWLAKFIMDKCWKNQYMNPTSR